MQRRIPHLSRLFQPGAFGRPNVSAPSPMLTNLLAWYPLGDGLDAHSGHYDLTAQNTPTYGAGKVGNAATFVRASDQLLKLSGNPAALQIQAMSGGCWFKTSDASNAQTIVGKRNAWLIVVESGVLKAYDWVLAAYQSTGVSVADGNWHWVGWTRATGATATMSVYVDQTTTADKTFTSQYQDQTFCFCIGGMDSFSGQASNASVDEVAIWNAVVSTSILALHRNGGAGTAYPGGG